MLDEFQSKVLNSVDPAEVVDLTSRMVELQSHRNARGRETEVATYIRDTFARAGIPAVLEEVVPGRPNVVATLSGFGGGPTLMFNGHTDTVPPGDMKDAFLPKVEGGFLSGRGSCDMKGGLAAQIAAMLAIKRSGVALRGDLVFTGVVAEEDGTSLGALKVIRDGRKADMVVVAEPTNLNIAVAHKGFDYYQIEVDGRAAHSSTPEKGANAIHRAADIVASINRTIVPAFARTPHPLVGPNTINVFAISGFARSEGPTMAPQEGSEADLRGGTVPDRCVIFIDHRRLPGTSHLDLVGQLKTAIDDLAGSEATAVVHHMRISSDLETLPPLNTPIDSALVRDALLAAAAHLKRTLQPIGVPYWSDAALFNAHWNVPAIVFGPGDIAKAHSNTENVPLDELNKAVRINASLALSLLGTE